MIVADHGSVDGTRGILHAIATTDPRLTVLDDPEPAFDHVAKVNRLAARAAAGGARWVVPFDADEIWMTSDGRRIADALPAAAPRATLAVADVYNHWATGLDDPSEADPVRRMGWRWTVPLGLPKVAATTGRGLRIEDGNHGATHTGGHTAVRGLLQVRHYPYRSADQFVRKACQGAAARRLTPMAPGQSAHWVMYADMVAAEGPAAAAAWWRRYFHHPDPTCGVQPDPAMSHQGMVYDPVPTR